MTIAAWLLAVCLPLVIRAVIGLGFTALTFTGISAIVDQLVGLAQSNWAAMPAGVLQLAALSGIPQVMGMIFGAYAARMAIYYATGLKRFVLKS